MAGTLLHVTLADACLKERSVPDGILCIASEQKDDFRLGAVLVDLPFFENLFAAGIRVLAKMEFHLSVWGELLHIRSPSTFCRVLLDNAHSPAAKAMALGALTHMAVDVVFHKAIKRRVLEAADGTKGMNTLHKSVEDQMDIAVHQDRLGHTGIGTPYARTALKIHPDIGWTSRCQLAFAAVHGSQPTKWQLQGWLRSLRLFGTLNSSKRLPWANIHPNGDMTLRQESLELAEESLTLAHDYLQTGWAYLQGELDQAAFETQIPDLAMSDGGPAESVRRS